MADANAPEDSSCMICRPAELPVNPDKVSWKPVNDTGWLNRKSWYSTEEFVDSGHESEHV